MHRCASSKIFLASCHPQLFASLRQNAGTRCAFTAIIGLSAVAAVLLVGWPVAAEGAAGGTDPCSLLTQSEVDDAAEQSVGEGDRGSSNNCLW